MTHTGQAWDEEDIRNVRFLNRDKEVNQQWAAKLVEEQPIIYSAKVGRMNIADKLIRDRARALALVKIRPYSMHDDSLDLATLREG